MARSKRQPQVVVRVSYVIDPDNAKAAQEILNEGFRRAITRAMHEHKQKEQGGVA